MNKKFTFSIIMPVYNVEEYLEEAIESIINQTIGFEQHVELILINDGSPDNSKEICLNYKEKYPNNITFVDKENEGVSVARNVGLDRAVGQYVNFLDSDDTLDLDALEKAKGFFDTHGDKVDVVAIPVIFFEGRTGPHRLNKKFGEGEIINVEGYPHFIQLSAASTFIKRVEGIGNFRMTPGQKYGEDASLLTDIIMKKKKYGALSSTQYNYRFRNAGTSALQSSENSYEYFIPFLRDYTIKKLKHYSELYGVVPAYVQHVMMYDLQWRIRLKQIPTVIQNELDEYYECVLEILKYIDESIIMQQKDLNWYQKHALCDMKQKNARHRLGDQFYQIETRKVKRGRKWLEKYLVVDDKGLVKDYLIGRSLEIDICEISQGSFRMIGKLGSLFPQDRMSIYMLDTDNNIIQSNQYNYSTESRYMTGEKLYDFFGFQFEIPLSAIANTRTLRVFLKVDDYSLQIPLKFASSSRLSNKLTNSYLVFNNKLMIGYNHKKNRFDVSSYNFKSMFKKEKKVRKEMERQKVKNYKKISNMRILIRTLKMFKKTPINLFMDRIDKADDSAEVLIEYFNSKRKEKKQKNYYVISDESKDFERLKSRFKVVGYKSNLHKVLFLLSDNLISTHCDRFIYQLYTGTDQYFKDLKEFNFVFLQHGVTKDDMSNWLKRHDKNFRLFFTSSKYERDSITNGNYGYTKDQIKLSGMPRFDKLVGATKEKIILVMPTWRHGIVEEFSKKINGRPYSEKFKESEFFLKWKILLEDNHLHEKMNELGYKIVFVPHPSIRQQVEDFNTEILEVAPYEESYSSLLKKGSVLITDYSSVYFDFAYMKKPVFYYHFDKGNWDNEKGYFSYEEMGFGEIYKSNQELVEDLILSIQSGAEMETKYKNRVEDFFEYTDNNNSKRVYEEILKVTE